MEDVVMVIWLIFWPIDILMAIWYIFPRFSKFLPVLVCCRYKEKSGNPDPFLASQPSHMTKHDHIICCLLPCLRWL
jgi:hypothetical protein